MSAQLETFTTSIGVTPLRAPAAPPQFVLGEVSD